MKKPSPSRRRKKSGQPTAWIRQGLREMQREVDQLKDAVRYVVYEEPFADASLRFFLDVSADRFRLNDWTAATLFKQERVARLIARTYSRSRPPRRRLRVARVLVHLPGWRSGRGRRS